MLSPVFSPDAAAPAQERGSLEEPVRPYSDNLGAAADEFEFGGGSAAASQDDEEGEDGSAFGDGGEDYGAAATQGGWDDFGGIDGFDDAADSIADTDGGFAAADAAAAAASENPFGDLGAADGAAAPAAKPQRELTVAQHQARWQSAAAAPSSPFDAHGAAAAAPARKKRKKKDESWRDKWLATGSVGGAGSSKPARVKTKARAPKGQATLQGFFRREPKA